MKAVEVRRRPAWPHRSPNEVVSDEMACPHETRSRSHDLLGARPGLPLIHSGGIDWRAQPGLAGHKRHKGVMQSINQLESGGSTGGSSLSSSSSLVGRRLQYRNADDEVDALV